MAVRRRFVPPLLSLLLPIVATGLACGDDPEEPHLRVKSVVARFRTGTGSPPPFLDVPFPSDAYLRGGQLVVSGLERRFPNNAGFIAQQLAQVSGWSRIAPAMFAVDDFALPRHPDAPAEPASAGFDRATLPADEEACVADASSVFLVDLESGERVLCRAILLDERPVDEDAPAGRATLSVGPARGVVLREGHRYAAVLTNRVRDDKGKEIVSTADFRAAARGEGPLGSLYGPAHAKVMDAIGGALATDGAEIIAMAPYTTQSGTAELFALRDALEAAEAPALAWDEAAMAPMGAVKFADAPGGTLPEGFTASLDAWLGEVPAAAKLPDGTDDPDESLPVRAHDAIASFGSAVFDATSYLRVRSGSYDDLEHATFARDEAGNVVPAPEKPTAKIWVSFAIPKGPMPEGGYPTVIVQHGLSGSRAYLLALANTFCKKGWIAVAIDSVTFGARASGAKYQVDATTDYVKAPKATYEGPDGLADLVDGERAGSFDLFGALKNIGALRDQLRQAAFDTSQLVKVLRSDPDLSPLATGETVPRIDSERIAYVGDSLGGIEGAVAAAIEPHVKAWTLNVAGGGLLSEIGAHGPGINANLSLAGLVNFGFKGTQYTEGHALVVLGQVLAEAGDPIAYARYLVHEPAPLAGQPTTPRNIFQIEVIYDELVANEGNEALARAAGLSLATPNVGPNAGVFTLDGRAYPGGGIVLPFVSPDEAGGFHDTPKPGITAILAQVSPAQHGADLVRSTGNRRYAVPYHKENGELSVDLGPPRPVPCPYRELQASMVGFFEDAFAGRVPVVKGLPPPTR
jgi:dienelactone hydrolase